MTIRRIIELAVLSLALLIAAMSLHAWLASRDEQQRLATTLAAQKQLIDAADTRERTRQSALDATLAQIENLKRATQTPQQIITALPNYLPLPQPITFAPAQPQQGTIASQNPLATPPPTQKNEAQSPPHSEAAKTEVAKAGVASTEVPDRPVPSIVSCDPSSPNCTAQIPTADLKPLYDYVQNCRACQAQLAAAKQTASDDATKIAALTKERDAATTSAKGGNFWRRLRRNALWFAAGATLAAAATHHPQTNH